MLILEVVEASGSGTLEVVRTISRGAVEAGHEVIVAYGRRPETPADPAAYFGRGVEAVALPWPDRRPGSQVAAWRALGRLVRARLPEVVHLHSSFAGAVGAAAVRRRVPTVYTPHGYAFLRADVGAARRVSFRAAEVLVARVVDVVGAVSEAEAAAARALGAARVVTVANGIVELDELPAPVARVPTRVVAMGRVGPALSPGVTASILGALGDIASVEWIGGGPPTEEAPLRAAGIPITGWLSRDQAFDRLRTAAVLLRWSAWDAAPLTLLEAMAADVVAVASDIPANRELLGPAAVCPTPEGAIARIRDLIGDPSALAAAVRSQQVARDGHGAAPMVAGWLDVYTSVLAEAPTGSPPRTSGQT